MIASKEAVMVEDWIANAYEGMSRRQFLARMTASGVSLAGFAIAASPVAGEIIPTPTEGLAVADVKEMEAALKAAGKKAEFVLYPGAPHAFFADYRPEAARDAWVRCVAWFNKYLKG
jgi:acetyl esterase/lipase